MATTKLQSLPLRTISILAAVVIAAGAAFVAIQWANSADERALAGTDLVQVYVARTDIPAGTTAVEAGELQMLETTEMMVRNRPADAVTDLADIATLRATQDLLKDSVIQQAQWGEQSTTTTFEVPAEKVVLSLQVSVPDGVAGYVTPGDRIALIGHFSGAGGPTRIGPDGAPLPVENDAVLSKYVTTDIEVLKVGKRTVSTTETGETTDQIEQTDQILLTVAVSPADAEKIVFTTQVGVPVITLLGEQDDGSWIATDGATLPTTVGR